MKSDCVGVDLKRERQRGDSCLAEIRHVIFTGGKWSFGFMVFLVDFWSVAGGGARPVVAENFCRR